MTNIMQYNFMEELNKNHLNVVDHFASIEKAMKTEDYETRNRLVQILEKRQHEVIDSINNTTKILNEFEKFS